MRDAFGDAQLGGVAPTIAQLIKSSLGYKYHWAVADYLQRAARHIASKTDVDQAYALGQAAVEHALNGSNGVMLTIERTSDTPYHWQIGTAPLAKVANVKKVFPLNLSAKTACTLHLLVDVICNRLFWVKIIRLIATVFPIMFGLKIP